VKVLVVTNLYPPHALGGYELSCRDVVDRWQHNGHEVVVLTTRTTFHDPADDPPEPHVRRVLDWYWSDHRVVRPKVSRRRNIERRNQHQLRELLETDPPDVVSFWALGGMSMGLITTCIDRSFPIVAVVEDDWLVYAPRIDAWTSAWAKRPRWAAAIAEQLSGLPTGVPTLPASARVAFVSSYLHDRAGRDGLIGFTGGEIVPLGTDPVDFPSRRSGVRPWTGKLLAVGRVEPRKGFDIAVRALVGLPDVTLEIVGPADERHRDDLLALAAELGTADRVMMSGGVDRDKLAEVYAAADATLFLSRWEEPFGMVPLEAMTQATPVIATRRGGAAEFLTHNLNCLEVPIDDPEAVAAAVRALAADDGLRRRLVNGGLTTSAAYRIDRFSDDLEVLHRAAAGAGAGSEAAGS
jgi:glycosyltransferase involved in cell wall biosynthesis